MLLTVIVAADREQALLHECIDSARAVAGEILLVQPRAAGDGAPAGIGAGVRWLDLGELAAGDRDRVFEEAVSRATGEWVLFLEGHERLDPNGWELRRALATAEPDAYALRVRSLHASPGPCHRPVDANHPLVHGATSSVDRRSVRLFRRRAGFRFGGRVDPSIERSVRARGAVPGGCAAVVLAHRIQIRRTPDSAQARLAKARRLVACCPKAPEVWMDLGRCLLEELRSPAAARECFLEAWRREPAADAAWHAALAFAEEHRFEEALDFLDRALAGPLALDAELRADDVWELRGELLRRLGRPAEAASAYAQAVGLAPDRPNARIGLVETLCEDGRVEVARGHAVWLRTHYPGLSRTWIAGALVHLARGHPLPAIDALRVALDIEPHHPAARYDLAIAYARLGAVRRAREALCRAGETRGGIALARVLGGDPAPPLPSRPEVPRLGPSGVVWVAKAGETTAFTSVGELAADSRMWGLSRVRPRH